MSHIKIYEFGYQDSFGFGVNRMTKIVAYTFGQQLCNKVMFTLDQGKIMVLYDNNNIMMIKMI